MLVLGFPLLLAIVSLVIGPGLGKLGYRLGWGMALFSALALVGLHRTAPAFSSSYFGVSFFIGSEARFFLTIVFGVGTLIGLYAVSYMKSSHSFTRFFTSLGIFQFSMAGIAVSMDWLTLIVFWELTSLSSFLLIAHENSKVASQKGAMRAFLVTAVGGLCLTAAALVSWGYCGTWLLADTAKILEGHEAMFSILVFLGIFMGVITKSAQIPFHFWLPGAMAAPTPVSAYLHSATLVKAGLLLMYKFYGIFHLYPLWEFFMPIGLGTYLFGGFIAMTRDDLKELLAYSTIAQLGLIVGYLGMGTMASYAAASVHILSHAFFKACLFLCVGIVDHECGTRKISQLSGLAKVLPWTAVAATVASLSMAGVPFLNGFVSKELLVKVGLYENVYVLVALLLGAFFTFTYVLRFVYLVFWHGPCSHPKLHRPPFLMLFSPLVLAGLCVAGGLFPEIFLSLYDAMLMKEFSVTWEATKLPLSWWFGFGLPFALSTISLVIGGLIFVNRKKWIPFFEKISSPKSEQVLDWNLNRTYSFGKLIGEFFQDKLTVHRILPLLLMSVCGLFYWLFAIKGGSLQTLLDSNFLWVSQFDKVSVLNSSLLNFSVLALLIATLIVLLVKWNNRWGGVMALGGMGSSLVILFYILGAPDLALTQASVELVTLGLFSLALVVTKKDEFVGDIEPTRYLGMILRVVSSIVVGVFAFLATMIIFQDGQTLKEVSQLYGLWSKSQAGGANIVNVILVDFRGFDTLGEIVVLASAAVSAIVIYQRPALLGQLPQLNLYSRGENSWMRNWFVSLLNLLMVFGLFFIFRGHNEPGGGFIGGLVLSISVVVLKYFWPNGFAHLRPGLNAYYCIVGGFAVSLVSVTIPMFLKGAFFQSYNLGGFVTSTFFDLGLAFLVMGTAIALVDLPSEKWEKV